MGQINKSIIAAIKKNIAILDIAEENGIQIFPASTGNFTHRCVCPNPNHKSGDERTASLFIDAENNNFYCFGCSANFSSIDFYGICNNLGYKDAISELSNMLPEDFEYVALPQTFDDTITHLKVSNKFRNLLLKNKSKYKDFAKLSISIEKNMEKIPRDNKGALDCFEKKVIKYMMEKFE